MAQKSNGVVQIYIAEVLRRKGRVVKQRRGGAERCEARGGEVRHRIANKGKARRRATRRRHRLATKSRAMAQRRMAKLW